MLRLTIELEGKKVDVHELKDGETIIGRSRTSDIKVNAPDISRAHLKLTVSGGAVLAENLSKFGSKLGGQALEEPAAVVPGERLYMGDLASLLLEEVTDDEGMGSMPDIDSMEDPHSQDETLVAPDELAGSDEGAPKTGEDLGAEPPSDPGTFAGEKTGMDGDVSSITEPGLTGSEVASGGEGPDATAAPPLSTRMAPTGVGDSEPGGTGIMPAALKTRLSMSTGTEVGHTRAMQTRLVSPEELDFLKIAEQKRTRTRMMLGIAIAIPVLILAIIFRPRRLPPETVIEWPKDQNGRYLDDFEAAPSGGFSDGGFDIAFPKTKPRKITPIDGGMVVQVPIGRERNIPLRISLQERSDKQFIKMTRSEAVKDWMREVSEGSGKWNFDRPYSLLGFYGTEQGIPYVRIPYQRDEQGSWFGMACLFRYGQKRYVLRAEIPAAERLRGEKMVLKRYIRPSKAFERGHWEATETVEKTSIDDLLRDARRELARMAPATWAEIESLLRAVLTKSVLTDNTASYKEAIDLLVELRGRQANWFNSQEFARDNALAQGSQSRAVRIAEFTKAVFSNMEDQRYYWVRKW